MTLSLTKIALLVKLVNKVYFTSRNLIRSLKLDCLNLSVLVTTVVNFGI